MKAFQIKGFLDYYITDTGEVYSRNYRKTGRVKKLSQNKTKSGYLYIGICKNKKQIKKRVHRLVAEAFIPNPDNKPEINHKNGVKTDNRVENLEWVNRSENIKHAYDVLKRPVNKNLYQKRGKDNPKSKTILQIKDGIVIEKFYGAYDAQNKTGVCQANISKCCNKKRKSAGGYRWEYDMS